MISETRGVGRWVIFSPPTTRAERWSPAARVAKAVYTAAMPEEVAVSTRRAGTWDSPRCVPISEP